MNFRKGTEKISIFTAEIHCRNGLILFDLDFSGDSAGRDAGRVFKKQKS
jgi:hypothetical protein